MPARIAVVLKYVLDPEILARDFAIDAATGLPSSSFPNYQFDPYDRIALEIALSARDRLPDAKIVSLCVGPDAAEDRLREALAIKSDEAALVETEGRAVNDCDRAAIAAAWLKDQSDISIVLCGRLTADTDSSEAGPVLAERLGWPMIANVVAIEMRDGRIVCKREAGEGYEWLAVDAPFVATATNAPTIVLRKAKLQDVMRAQKTPIVRQPAESPAGAGRQLRTVRAYIPDVTRVCHWIEGDNAEDKARALSSRLLAHLDAVQAAS